MCEKNLLVVYLVFIKLTDCLEFMLGDCPVYFKEPCRADLVKFVLSAHIGQKTVHHQVNPFKVMLPRGFNTSTPTKVLIHGYGGLAIDKALTNLTKSYRNKQYNIISVDWSALGALPCYATAYLNTWHVGQCVAILAVGLIPFGLSPSSLHLIGFSLGAHVAGFAGAALKKVLHQVPGRITGLDPALPFFATMNNEWKLDASDAQFVDIVHTSSGSFGKIEASGHVDFYVNGGVLQPACYKAPHPPLCSHVMSGIYFAESVENQYGFKGRQCENLANYFLGLCRKRRKAIMGERVSFQTKGSYYVDTAAYAPFALN